MRCSTPRSTTLRPSSWAPQQAQARAGLLNKLILFKLHKDYRPRRTLRSPRPRSDSSVKTKTNEPFVLFKLRTSPTRYERTISDFFFCYIFCCLLGRRQGLRIALSYSVGTCQYKRRNTPYSAHCSCALMSALNPTGSKPVHRISRKLKSSAAGRSNRLCRTLGSFP